MDVQALPDTELFFVDKEQNQEAERLTKESKKGSRKLRSQAILTATQAQGTTSGKLPARSKTPAKKSVAKQLSSGKGAPAVFDLWNEQLDSNSKKRPPLKRKRSEAATAVEVAAPGSSINPDPVYHGEAVAEAVAAEMETVYQRERQAVAPPATVSYLPDSGLEELQVEAEVDEADLQAEEAVPLKKAALGSQRKPKTVRNKELRNRSAEVELEKKRSEKQQLQDLQRLKQVKAELDAQEAERQARRDRKAKAFADKRASQPPKLGKHKFKDAPIQVLLSEEITGSLRKLKPSVFLTQDRFVSLQKRALIEPRVPIRHKKVAKKVQW